MKMKFYQSYNFKIVSLVVFFIALLSIVTTTVSTHAVKNTALRVFSDQGMKVVKRAQYKIDPERFEKLAKTHTMRNFFQNFFSSRTILLVNSSIQ